MSEENTVYTINIYHIFLCADQTVEFLWIEHFSYVIKPISLGSVKAISYRKQNINNYVTNCIVDSVIQTSIVSIFLTIHSLIISDW